MDQNEIDRLVATADKRAVYANQVGHAKDRFLSLNRMFWEGHEFEVTQMFFCYVILQYMSMQAEADGLASVTLLDINNEPVLVEDLAEFVDQMQEKHTEALNEYQDRYSQLQSGKDVDDLIRKL